MGILSLSSFIYGSFMTVLHTAALLHQIFYTINEPLIRPKIMKLFKYLDCHWSQYYFTTSISFLFIILLSRYIKPLGEVLLLCSICQRSIFSIFLCSLRHTYGNTLVGILHTSISLQIFLPTSLRDFYVQFDLLLFTSLTNSICTSV